MAALLTREVQQPCSVPAAKLFQMILEQDTHMPKILPQAIKSSENLQGSGGPGTIKKINYANVAYGKKRVDVIDKDNFTFACTCFEAQPWIEGLDKITFELKFVASPDGGSIFKLVTKYYAKAGNVLHEEQIKGVEEMVAAIPKAIEAYCKANHV